MVLSLLDFCNSLFHKRCHGCGCGHGIEVSFIVVKPCIIPSSCLTETLQTQEEEEEEEEEDDSEVEMCPVHCSAVKSWWNLQTSVFEHLFSDDHVTMSNYNPQGPPVNQQQVKLIDNDHFHDNLHFVCDMFDPQLPRRKQRRRVAPSNLSLNGAVVFTSRWLKSWLERRSSCLFF